MLSSMSPMALSHGDDVPGAGEEDCIKAELGNSPRHCPTQRRASPAQLFVADSGGLSVV